VLVVLHSQIGIGTIRFAPNRDMSSGNKMFKSFTAYKTASIESGGGGDVQ
jgi:hypothetical protein